MAPLRWTLTLDPIWLRISDCVGCVYCKHGRQGLDSHTFRLFKGSSESLVVWLSRAVFKCMCVCVCVCVIRGVRFVCLLGVHSITVKMKTHLWHGLCTGTSTHPWDCGVSSSVIFFCFCFSVCACVCICMCMRMYMCLPMCVCVYWHSCGL